MTKFNKNDEFSSVGISIIPVKELLSATITDIKNRMIIHMKCFKAWLYRAKIFALNYPDFPFDNGTSVL